MGVQAVADFELAQVPHEKGLAAAGRAADHLDVGARHVEETSQIVRDLGVGLAVHGGRGDGELYRRLAVEAFYCGALGPGRDPEFH